MLIAMFITLFIPMSIIIMSIISHCHWQAEDYEDRNAGRAWEREVYLSDQVDSFKVHLLSHLPPSLLEETLLRGVLAGIRGAIIDKKRRWTPTTNMTKFTRYQLNMSLVL